MSSHLILPAFPEGPLHGSVVLNFLRNPPSEFGAYASAFHRAGCQLVKDLASAHGYRDTDACPIVFLYRQALELYVKGTIVSGERLLALAEQALPITSKLLREHRLSPLVPALDAVFQIANWSWPVDVPNFGSPSEFGRYLDALESVDPLSFAFRYPTNKAGEANLSHHFRFNVITFAETLDPILNLLNGGLTGLDELWQERAEAVYQQQNTPNFALNPDAPNGGAPVS
jgi:hypothetical protein